MPRGFTLRDPALLAGIGGGGGVNLASGLKAWWSMDEAAGNDRVDSVGGHDAAEVGGNVNEVSGKQGNAAFVEWVGGGSTHLAAPHHSDISLAADFTVAGWFRITQKNAGNFNPILVKGDGTRWGGFEWGLYYDAPQGLLDFLTADNGGGVGLHSRPEGGPPYTDPALNTWYFFRCWRLSTNGTRVGFQLNGNTPSESFFSPAAGTYPTAASPLYFGFEPGPFTADVQLDEVAIWHRELSAAEHAALYNAGAGIAYGDI